MFLTKKSTSKQAKAKGSKALGGWDDDDNQSNNHAPGIDSKTQYSRFGNQQKKYGNDSGQKTQFKSYNNSNLPNLLDEQGFTSSSKGDYKAVFETQASEANKYVKKEAWTNNGTEGKINQTQLLYTTDQLASMKNIDCQCKAVEAVLVPGGVRIKPNDSLLNQFYSETKNLNTAVVGSLLISFLYNPNIQFQVRAKSLYVIQFLCKKNLQFSVYFKLHSQKIKDCPECEQNNQNYLKIKKHLLSTLGAVVVLPEQRRQEQQQLLSKQGISYTDPGYNAGEGFNLLGIKKMPSQREKVQKQVQNKDKKLISPLQAKKLQKKVLTGPKSIAKIDNKRDCDLLEIEQQTRKIGSKKQENLLQNEGEDLLQFSGSKQENRSTNLDDQIFHQKAQIINRFDFI